MNQNLNHLYNHTLDKYRKFKSRYNKGLKTGRFFELSEKKRHLILARLAKLRQRLNQLRLQLKLALAGGALAIALSASSVDAQQLGPFKNNPDKNPLPPPKPNPFQSKPAYVDWDNDGDLDFVIGYDYGSLIYLENIGDNNNIKLIERIGTDNPFNAIDVGDNSAPAFIDWDRDGDQDLFVGEYDNELTYFRNDGGKLVQDDANNPFNGFDFLGGVSFPNPNTRPVFVDFDSDGDQDLFVARNAYMSNSILYFENSFDTDGVNKLNQTTSPIGYFSAYNLYPAFSDVDQDGDLDLFLGNVSGKVNFYKNNLGTFNQQTGTWDSSTATGNPLNSVNTYEYAAPTFLDLDGDDVHDLAIIGQTPANYPTLEVGEPINYFVNKGDFNLEKQTGASNPFDGVDIGVYSDPEFADLDGDGDMDLLLGGRTNDATYNPALKYYQNDISSFSEQTHPILANEAVLAANGIFRAKVALGDVDGDTDLDMFACNNSFSYGSYFFENNDTDDTYNSFGPTDANNPLRGSVIGGNYEPDMALIDIDDDGDLDAFICSYSYSQVRMYINNSGFSEQDGTDDLLAGSVSYGPTLKPIDIDHDGDYDMLVGLRNGGLSLYKNTGSPSTPVFTAVANGLNTISVESNMALDFLDWDKDGDLDAFVGSDNGQIVYFENQNMVPKVSVNSSPDTFTEGNGPLNLSVLGLADDGTDDIIGATISITNFVDGEDVLSFTPQFGITGNFDVATGVLTLSGYATLAQYETVLQSITYENTSITPNTVQRNIEFAVTDFDATDPYSDSVPEAVINVDVVAVNSVPVATASAGATTFTEDQGPVVVDNSLTISDDDNINLTGATLSITGNFVATEDLLVFSDQNGIAGNYDNTTGILTLSGTSSVANYQAALRSITYENTSEDPDNSTRTITFSITDGIDVSTDQTKDVLVVPVNDLPVITSINDGVTVSYSDKSQPIVVDDQINIVDPDNNNLASATIQIGSFQTGDNLIFTDQNGITGSFNNGILSLSGTATLTDYQVALQSVEFESTSDSGTRSIDFTVNDGTDNSSSYTRAINLAINQPPKVDTTPASAQTGSVVTIDLCQIISDPDNDFTELTVNVVSITSGAATSINDCELEIDYSGTNFSGADQIVVEACDPSGACDENTLNIDVEEPSEVTVYNAVSPNGDGENDWWIITGLQAPNKIELYNRWGDLVKTLNDFETSETTPNNALDDLPAGTYFYKIKSEQGSFNGYLVIKK